MKPGLHQIGLGLRAHRSARPFRFLAGAWLGAVVAGTMVPGTLALADNEAVAPLESAPTAPASDAKPQPAPQSPDASAVQPAKPDSPTSFKAMVRALVEQEASKTGLPADIAEAVVHVESNYDPNVIGSVGEIGLMQVRPETAAMLGFRGSNEELAKPEVNVHYGVLYLSKAWRLANGDLCRALMKYRAGHGEEIMTPRSVDYCLRARNHLAALGSPFAAQGTTWPVVIPASTAEAATAPAPNSLADSLKLPVSPKAIYARYKRGTPAASRAFWAAQEARVRAITARIDAKWHRVASR
ncbi:MAG TPA: transglycosylase SLT domain-containing protein [Bradyrhizobium sp.]|nr:transglycosylase SLT domain-containing protein [Bradyrhizobium sp.]